MGVDLLDITFRVEKEFQFKMPRGEMHALTRENDIRAGDLYDYILARLDLRDSGWNDLQLNHFLWLQMQESLQIATDAPWDKVRLDVELATLFPDEDRRSRWDALREACPFRLPDLDYPTSVRIGGIVVALLMAALEQLQFWQLPAFRWLWLVVGVLGVWMVVETYLKIARMCAPLRYRLPHGLRTVKDLCRTTLAANYREISKAFGCATDERCADVWHRLSAILCDTLGVPPHAVTFRSRIIADLGAE